jgi:carbon-monoxide dehydrogenase medium subunit
VCFVEPSEGVPVKPPSFEYHRPATVAEALEVLAALGPDGKVLAGGQSLVPLLNMRLAAPKALVDINGLGSELDSLALAVNPDRKPGDVRVGALARHSRVTRSRLHPLLSEASRFVAHPTIRNRGTTVGSLVHADPAAELPAVLVLCDGSVELASLRGSRSVPAASFFLGPLESALEPGELAVAARFALPSPRTGYSFVEVSRRAGDYALAGLAMAVTLDAEGHVACARAAYLSVGPTPLLVDLTDAVAGSTMDWAAAGALAMSHVEPDEDIHATAEYRRHLVGVLTQRAGAMALTRAREAVDAHSP